MRDDRERLLDIQEAIENVQKYGTRGKDAFKNDELVQTWVLHHIQILGEATARISDEFQEEHPDIPWFKIIGMRNILVHDYFHVDIEAVWSVVENDLPVLYDQVNLLLREY
ncbi:MAG: HepT-like ribonuclease domain-containing protein [Planctomycetota bacterium]|jgi:uncharacterized protein with HEPN domain